MVNKIQHNEKKTFLSMPQCIQKNKHWKYNFGFKVFKSSNVKTILLFYGQLLQFLFVSFNEHFCKKYK